MKKSGIVNILVITSLLVPIGSAMAVPKPLIPVAKNPIVNRSLSAGIIIASAMVQDNVDPSTKRAIPDRLMLKVVNKSSKPASGFEIFYTMRDSSTKVSESYYQKLTGFNLKAGATSYLYFDNLAGAGHFLENKFSIYRSSVNEVKFSIILSAKGFKVATASAVKDKGTGEKVD